jgi:uncharacterized protein (UPF0332 family)
MYRFDFKEFLDVAQFLKNGEAYCSQEAKSRSAVSRAYYSAFHKTRIFLKEWYGFSYSESREVHQEVIDDIVTVGLEEVSKELTLLRGWRNQCDYDESVPGLADILDKAIDQAQQVINDVAPY